MNGAEETRGFMMKTLADQVLRMQRDGCEVGKVTAEKVRNLELCLGAMQEDIKSGFKEMGSKINVLTLSMLVLSFLAGGLWIETILKMLSK